MSPELLFQPPLTLATIIVRDHMTAYKPQINDLKRQGACYIIQALMSLVCQSIFMYKRSKDSYRRRFNRRMEPPSQQTADAPNRHPNVPGRYLKLMCKRRVCLGLFGARASEQCFLISSWANGQNREGKSVGTAALHSLRHDRGSHANNSASEHKPSPFPALLASQLARARQGEGGRVNRLKDVIIYNIQDSSHSTRDFL
ncbi:hypothetical protein E2C01_003985 [Portunus trituberculatus]|uniref:Uncharacterized protein n=1 Tax=Portunus trituberculatus TaxID=210409 RepID=A0A5B7CV58_PORTR|nr:hypothetical protein [Portunus trituberculatus]